MIYTYKCERCGVEKDLNYKMGKAPKRVKCKECKEGWMYRVFNLSINIPYDFRNPPAFDYDKSPSATYGAKKRFFMNKK